MVALPAASARVPLFTKITFAVGTTAENIALFAVSSYAFFFYNQVRGLDPTWTGLALGASLLLDGFSDPIIGSISDRTRSKWGRRHPFMFAAPIPVVLSLIAVFNPPEMLSGFWLFLWFTAFVSSMRVCMAVYHTPHLALAAEMTKDFTERSRVLSWNTLFGQFGSAGVVFVALTFFFHKTEEYPRGLLNPQAYAPFGYAAGGAVLLLLFVSAWFTRDRIALMAKLPDDLAPFSPFAFMKDIGAVFTNRNYVFMLIGMFFIAMTTGIRSGLALYINTFYWELTSEHIRWFVLANVVGFFIGFAVTSWIHTRFGKRFGMTLGCAVVAVAHAIPVTLGIAGVLDADHPWLMHVLLAAYVLQSTFGCIMTISTLSAMGDIADENELRIGHRQEGVLYSTRTLFSKLDTAIGQVIAGLVLTAIAFPEKAVPGQVDADTLHRLAWVDGPIASTPAVIAAFFYARYRISKSKFDETRRLLNERHAPTPTAAVVAEESDVGILGAPPAGARP